MGQYLLSENESNPVWKDLVDAFEMCTMDIVSSSRKKYEQEECALIQKAVELHGGKAVIKCIFETIQGNCSWELFWLARAGVMEVESHLIALLDSDDEDELTSAVLGLLYFDNDKAWYLLHQLINGEHQVNLTQSPSWYFQEDLELISNPKAKKYLAMVLNT
ncbi:hypothetical protein B9G39_14935 [Zooshikella ganghwensis]|uniref:HEAT repeat domain-containing protein n=1 Tax=Zooshikella ganghwensis TaxID=202772 RepID=A0A4P9VMP1_9GAMM|nr:hypothetical protein B9G39_14935 [Zooshikella ganghwensis]